MLYYFEIHLMSLHHNVQSKPPVSKCLCAALYCPALPLTIPVSQKHSFVFIYMTNWDVCGLVVMKCGGSTHQ